MRYTFEDNSLKDFTASLASKAAVPGGGGASALCGAIAASLGSMVCELTIGKKKYEQFAEELEEIILSADKLRTNFLSCINKDAEMFEPLSKAYGIPKDDPSREEVLEKCLRDAASAPLEIFDLSCECIEMIGRTGEIGSKLAVSDAATGVCMALASLRGAATNVRVNTSLMKDREYAARIDNHIDKNLAQYSEIAENIFFDIYEKL